jgi:hypothetical protein
MTEKVDWYPTDRATERLMYGNVDAKLDGYAVKYPFLTADYRAQVHAMCRTFVEAYDKIEYNRATARQATQWFENLMNGSPQGEAAPAPPAFQPIVLPAGALIGIEKSFRAFAGLFKKQLNYDKADGLDLMIERGQAKRTAAGETAPELKYTVSADGVVTIEWKKTGYDALEVQYRKLGAEMWQAADKSTEKIIEVAPPLAAPGVPEKFEFRAVALVKNRRTGSWSSPQILTVG